MTDPNSFNSFGTNDVCIPLVVLEELDSQKKRMDEVGRNARDVCRNLDELRSRGSLNDWVSLENGGRLKIVNSLANIRQNFPSDLIETKNDNIIITLARYLKDTELDGSERVVLVSKDINVRIKCDALGVKAEDYKKSQVALQANDIYTGVSVVSLSDDQVAAAWSKKCLLEQDVNIKSYQNQIVVIPKGDDHSSTTVLRRKKNYYKLVEDHHNVFGLEPKTKEQNFALELLLDPEVKLVTLSGKAGCGKTAVALAAGLHQTLGQSPVYEKMIVTRPVEPVGKDIGFLPGSLAEKMEPWIAPIKDNLAFLLSKSGNKKQQKSMDSAKDPYMELLFRNGKIEVEAVTYIRGRSIPNSFIIVDEAQNLTPHQLKTIITRSGENSKIVLCGDVEQIDVSFMDSVSNGLSFVIETFKEQELAGHVTMLKGVRSPLASLAAQLM